MGTSENNAFDVIIIGAGISGVNFAYRLQTQNPELTFTILEGREAIGGTWDLFKYPGIRSDSDLYTFGFPWRPWSEQKSIAEGPLIVKYVRESAAMYGIDKKVQFKHKVSEASWSTKEQSWSLAVDANGTPQTFRSRFMLLCTGYYDYKQPLQTTIPGIDTFKGQVVHPQFWPENLDYKDKEVVIIGSGATAITLLPAMAKDAKHVTMLQRSPSYVLSQPAEDGLEKAIRAIFPVSIAHKLVRIKWLVIPYLFISFCTWFPNAAKKMVRSAAKARLPVGMELDPNFNPSYSPFQQRMCFCPDGDFYESLKKGKSSIQTGIIEKVTEKSIKLESGQEMMPDIIVTATGLKIQLAGGMKLLVDGNVINVSDKFVWKSVMMQDLPNAAFVVGYTDASWTLGADSTAQLICRLLKRMDKEKTPVVVPRLSTEEEKKMKIMPYLKLQSTYVQKAKNALPKAGDGAQWRARSTYFNDLWQAKFGDIRTGLQYIK